MGKWTSLNRPANNEEVSCTGVWWHVTDSSTREWVTEYSGGRGTSGLHETLSGVKNKNKNEEVGMFTEQSVETWDGLDPCVLISGVSHQVVSVGVLKVSSIWEANLYLRQQWEPSFIGGNYWPQGMKDRGVSQGCSSSINKKDINVLTLPGWTLWGLG